MAKVIHKIDPNADTIIILKNPLVHFAVWDQPDIEEIDAEEPVPTSEPNIEETVTKETTAEVPSFEEIAAEESVLEPNTSEVPTHDEEIHYHVSSSHLRLASPEFEVCFPKGTGRKVTSLPAWRDTLRAETYKEYFDFNQLDFCAHVNFCHSSVQVVYFRYS